MPLDGDIRDRQNLSSLDLSSPAVRRQYALLRMARLGARSLPEGVEFLYLLYPYIAEQRGDGLNSSDYAAGYGNQLLECKATAERRARELRVPIEQLDERMGKNVCFLLVQNPRLMVHDAVRQYLERVSSSGLDLASRSDLEQAKDRLKADIVAWLRRQGIPFSIKPTISIPTTTLTTLLQPFTRFQDFYVAPQIPQEKMINAMEAVGVPEFETICALVDCTFFGSAKDCVLFGSKAIYFRNHGVENFLPYSEFLDVTFFPDPAACAVGYGNWGKISLSGGAFPPVQLAEVLDALKREALKRESQPSSSHSDGLSSIPGMAELKRMLLEEVVEPLRNPEEFKRYKIEIPNGILMYGPPGCGKTFVAKKLAAELNYNFYEVSPSEVGSMYVHGSALKIRQLFDEAAAHAPALMFVDEFEGMVPSRRDLTSTEQFKGEEVNEWLVQIGACSSKRILLVAATNEPWRIDEAIQRSGRLDKKVYVGSPDEQAIGDMLLYHLQGRPHTPKETIREFASTIAGQGYSASDLKLIVDESAKFAMKDKSDISPKHLTRAAAERVPPSISPELEDGLRNFARSRVTREGRVTDRSSSE